MRRGFVLLLLALVVAGSAYALPSYQGVRGLNRVVDAKPIGAGEFSLALFSFMGQSRDVRTGILGGTSYDIEDTEYDGTWYITTAFGLGSKFEVAGRVSYVLNALNRCDVANRLDAVGDWENDDGFSEAALFIKYGTPLSERFHIGLMPWAGFAIYDGGDQPYVIDYDGYDGIWHMWQPMFEMRRPMIGTNLSAGADLLMSLDMDPAALHLNVGYHYYRQSFEFTDRRYSGSGWTDTVDVDMEVEDPVFRLAAGVEYPIGNVTLFTEAEWMHHMTRDWEMGDNEDFDDYISVSPGLRLSTKSGLAFDVVGSFALSDFDPEFTDLGHHAYQAGETPSNNYRAHFAPFPGGYPPEWGVGLNIMYSSDLRPDPTTGMLSGVVTDAETGALLSADVGFPGTAVAGVTTDMETGYYEAELPEGSVDVSASAEGYQTASAMVSIPAGGSITRDFALQPISGMIVGSVTDLQSGLPIAGATVDSDIPESDMTGSDGLYGFDAPEGTWTVTATAPGYLGDTAVETVMAGETVTIDFELQPVDFEPVYFEVDRSNVRQQFHDQLAGIAEAISEGDLSVLIAGHTDSDNTDEYNMRLSEERAQAVYDYLVDLGVPPSLLSTEGYGENRPAVPNTSPENKALNRRVEFVVEGAM